MCKSNYIIFIILIILILVLSIYLYNNYKNNKNESFINEYSKSGEVSYTPWLIDFCKLASIGEFFPIYACPI